MSEHPYASFESFVALPRVDALTLSPDGTTVVVTVATLNRESTAYERALWAVDAAGGGTPRRLTRSAKGESGAAFTASGELLFVSARPDTEVDDGGDAAQLWTLPLHGAEGRALTDLPAGVSSIAASAAAVDRVIIGASLLPSSTGFDDERERRKARKEKKVRAILHERYPVRHWDHDLGPGEPHLIVLDGELADASEAGPAARPALRDLTRHPGRRFDSSGESITPDGSTLIVATREQRDGRVQFELVAIDVASGTETPLFSEPGFDYAAPVVNRAGTHLAYVRSALSNSQGPSDAELWFARIDGSERTRLATTWDRWPSSVAFDGDDASLIVAADDDGRAPVFRIPLDGGEITKLTHDDAAYHSVRVASDGTIVALRSNWLEPPHPVRIDANGVTRLATPAPVPSPIARMENVETLADDGAKVRAWLLLPQDAPEPAPLLLWIHGGPLSSWNAWSWRWAPQLLVAKGYAVLLPDPALSTGYGLDFIARGWNAWGKAPYTDLMAITDAAVARDDIDATRVAAMGGSFGGYMANWVAGHTDRFKAIVTHASLWALDQFSGTTDFSPFWRSIFTPEAAIENSPHQFVADIVSPMLVIHGDKDYRVPIGEGLRLWSDLAAHHADADGAMQHRYLHFPNENHWVLTPQHSIVWYETVSAFLAQHVLGEEWERPVTLG